MEKKYTDLVLALVDIAESRGINCEIVERKCPACTVRYVGPECPACAERHKIEKAVQDRLEKSRAAVAKWRAAQAAKEDVNGN